jgi:hypothetical protein
MMRRLASVVVAAIAITTACGGGGGGGGSSSRDLFVAQANQLCTALSDSYTAEKAKLPSPPSAADIKDFVQGSFAPQAVTTYEQIAALPMPSAEKDDLQSLLTAAIAEVRLIQADPATNGTPLTQRELVRRFQAVGLTACGAGFQHELDKAQFVKEANGICLGLASKVYALLRGRGINEDSTSEEKAIFVKLTIVPLYFDVVTQIESLGFPAEDQQVLADLLAAWRADIGAVEQQPELSFDPNRVETLDVKRRWIEYGARSCGTWTQ